MSTVFRVPAAAALLLFGVALGMIAGGCRNNEAKGVSETEDRYEKLRLSMVEKQIVARGVSNARVLEAMRKVPRHEFVPGDIQKNAYEDNPLPIGYRQTISQPYIVAIMTELLEIEPGEKVLEVGTGSGYQAAVLAEITDLVFSIEIVRELAEFAAHNLERQGYDAVQVRAGDGYRGWPDEAPFDGIIVTAAPDHIPEPLIEQLAEGGRLVIPVGDFYQELVVITKEDGKVRRKASIPVRFVPMTGEAEAK